MIPTKSAAFSNSQNAYVSIVNKDGSEGNIAVWFGNNQLPIVTGEGDDACVWDSYWHEWLCYCPLKGVGEVSCTWSMAVGCCYAVSYAYY